MMYNIILTNNKINYILNDSPQPHVPFIFGLLNTNSADSLSSTKSISVPGNKKLKQYKEKWS